jgi:tripartite-type tricarboxylate transporter receptor subunit TctC
MRRIKTVLGFAVGLALGAATLLANAAQAQGNYPNRPIRIIVPYPAGGIVDIVARAVTEQVGRDWKQTVAGKAGRQQQHRHRRGGTQRT